MTKNTSITGLAVLGGLLLMLAAALSFPLTSSVKTVEAASDLRVAVGCSPLTSSQKAQPGDPQLCRIRVQNRGAVPITGITVSRPTPNTITDRYSYGYIPLTCDLAGCDPFTLNPGQTAYIFEESTFNPYQDGRGKTKATATGYQGAYQISASATEQTNLP